MEELILKLQEIGAIKFGEFTLRSGQTSPVYIDLRVIISYPKILQAVAASMAKLTDNLAYDVLCGVPYTALPIATVMGQEKEKPLVLCRKEAKAYGTKKRVEGVFQSQDRCLIIEDVVTTGQSVLDVADILEKEGLFVKDVVVFVDREQQAKENLKEKGYTLHAVCTLSEILCIASTR